VAGFWLGPRAATRGYRLFGYDSIGSTSAEAMAAAARGDGGDVWFVARQQTAGRGRRGRPWQSPPGNLAASLLLVHHGEPGTAAGLGFVAGVALHRALADCVPSGTVRIGIDGADGSDPGRTRIALKWPNDVTADGAKLAGILLEARPLPAAGGMAVVIGFGVNVVAAPGDLPYPATSLADLGAQATAESLFAALSESWVDAAALWNGGAGIGDVLGQWRLSATGMGSDVAVSHDGGVIRGIFETIDDTGRLLVRAQDGRCIAIAAGDVHFGATATSGH
jgi:BirA family biotin operon repressor/biotin-[acetyl-CoA-carboxylase] ligase